MARQGGGRVTVMVSALAFVLLALVVPGSAASAAGNPSLQAEIVGDPLSHGVSLGSGFLDPFSAGLQKAASSAGAASGVSVSAAALGWTEPGTKPKHLFVVALSALDWPGQRVTTIDKQAALAAKAAAATTCAGELGSPPKIDVSVRGIPNSHFFECDRAPDGSVLDGVTTSRQNVFAMVISHTKAMTKTNLESLALKQYRRLHKPEPSVNT
jgi:hypothetical protein